MLGNVEETSYDLRVLIKEPLKLDLNKNFMWVFDYYSTSTLVVKDIVEITDYDITIDEETNAKSTINVLKQTNARANDIIAVKHDNQVVYWGIIDEIQNESGALKQTFVTRYITNLFDQKIPLETYYNFKTKIVSNTYGLKNNSGNVGVSTVVTADVFDIRPVTNGYRISTGGKYLTNVGGTPKFTDYSTSNQVWTIDNGTIGMGNQYLSLERGVVSLNNYTYATTWTITSYTTTQIIKQIGIEDEIENAIENNFTQSSDSLLNIKWLDLVLDTHTPKNTRISNVEEGIYNLHTWMTNCNQYYNLTYGFDIVNQRLQLTMKVQTYDKKLIDTNAQAITNYTEVFETDVMAKVIVLYDKVADQDQKGRYTLYLKNDRTTTTDATDTNRAEGKATTIHTENYEDANQSALDEMKGNDYNHNITFGFAQYIAQGTPIAIKTKNSTIYNTYISQVKIRPNKIYEYICGNIRINFIEKLNKEKTKYKYR